MIMTKAEIIKRIIELKDFTFTHEEMMRMSRKTLVTILDTILTQPKTEDNE